MADVAAPNAPGEVDEAVTVNIFENCALSFGGEDRSRVKDAARHCGVAALHQRLRARAGNFGLELDGGHGPNQYQPIGCSLRLMCTCLVSKYSSMPQGPSSRPK